MQNNWISYISRTYTQIKDDILARLGTDVSEITDHTESNFMIKFISIWAAIAEMLNYYIDNAARETHVVSSRVYANMVKHAFSRDYRIHCLVAASVDVKFALLKIEQEDITIPVGTIVSNSTGVQFYTTKEGTIVAGELSVTLPAKQGVSVTDLSLGNATGLANLTLEINDLTCADQSVTVKVNNIGWTSKETLAYSAATDQHFVQSVSVNKKPNIRFGDGFNGEIPSNGHEILISYKQVLGANGNLPANTITTIVSSLTLPNGASLSVTNEKASTGGSGFETLEQMRYRIPRARRTLQRAVTDQDHIDLMETFAGLYRAGLDFDCGRELTLYVVPDGGGVASTQLLSDAQTFIDDRRMPGTKVTVKAAGELEVSLTIELQVRSQYSRADTITAVKNNVSEFISYEYQKVQGIVQIGDVYEKIENTPGVENSVIKSMVAKPYARQLGDTTTILSWVRTVQEASDSTIKWNVKMTSSTEFQLFRANNFIGTFDVGTEVTRTEIVFTVNSNSYVAGDEWEFYTYSYTGTLKLAEPSIPVASVSDISITATGGI